MEVRPASLGSRRSLRSEKDQTPENVVMMALSRLLLLCSNLLMFETPQEHPGSWCSPSVRQSRLQEPMEIPQSFQLAS